MNWLKRKWAEDPTVLLFGVSALLTGTASLVLLKKNAKLQMSLANMAKDTLESCVEAFNEGSLAGYDLAMEGHNRPIITQ